MRKSAVRVMAVAMAIGAATSAGSALAAASPAAPPPAEQVATAMTKDPQQAAKHLKRLHDELSTAFDARSVADMQQASEGVRATLGALELRDRQWQLHDQTVQRLDEAEQQNTDLSRQLSRYAEPTGNPDLPPLPSVPPPLDSLSSLVQGLLANLQGIVQGVLPIPAPPVGVPVTPVPVP